MSVTKWIYINSGNVIHNNNLPFENQLEKRGHPPVRVLCQGQTFHGWEAVIDGPSTLKYDYRSLQTVCPASIYVETDASVTLDGSLIPT